MSTEQNKTEIVRWEAAYNEGNLEKLDRLADEQCTVDYALHGADGTSTGPAGLKQSVRAFVANWSGMHVTLDDLIAEGDKVASRWTVRGTDAKQHKKMALMMLGISRFVEGKVAEEWVLALPLDD